MRKLVVTQNMTVDGAVEMLDDWFTAQAQSDMDDLIEENKRQSAEADGLLLGRTTFCDMRDYWRDLKEDRTGISDYLNSVNKYVLSSTLTDPDWGGTTILRGDPVDEVRALKIAPGKDIVLTGSITLAQFLVEADLVDEFRLFVYPVIQGRGRRLFPHDWQPSQFERRQVLTFRSGITLLTYGSS